MTDTSVDIADLNQSQQLALETYTSVTNQETSEAIPLLRRSEWNVQIAIAKFFDGETRDPLQEAQESLSAIPPPQSRRPDTLLDSFTSSNGSPTHPHTNREPAPRIVPQPESQQAWRPPLLFAILLSPFNLLTKLVGGSFSLIGYILSLIPRVFSGGSSRRLALGSRSGRKNLSPADAAARFTREFEEDYGKHGLPFSDRSYAHAYDLAKKDLKFLLVILISPEHDDTDAFVRETLLAPEVVAYMNEPQNKIILWAGTVQDSEAYQVSTALNCSKFPFAALIVHTPQDSTTAMSTVARITGLQTPSNFVSKLRQAISQHSPALERARMNRNEQQATRNLREEQNTAYERSLAQDRERTRQRREAEAAQRRAEEEAQAKAEAAEKKAQQEERWRHWRAQSISPEPGPDAKDVTRVSIRTPSGERLIRRFPGQAAVEELYAFVECFEILQAGSTGTAPDPPTGYEHVYRFLLVSPIPRVEYQPQVEKTIGEAIGKSGNLIVEAMDDDDE